MEEDEDGVDGVARRRRRVGDENDDDIDEDKADNDSAAAAAAAAAVAHRDNLSHFFLGNHAAAAEAAAAAAAANASSIETLLLNIQGLLKVAADNARTWERQMNFEKAEIKMEALREREMRESVEKQLHETRRNTVLFQRRLKKERRARRKALEDLEAVKHVVGLCLKLDKDVAFPVLAFEVVVGKAD